MQTLPFRFKSRLLLLILLCGTAAATAQTAGDTVRYSGKLKIDSNNSLLLTLTLVQQGDTTLAWLGSPYQSEQLFPASKSHIAKDSLSVSIKSLSAKLRGTFQPQAGEALPADGFAPVIKGKFFQGYQVLPITLQRYEGTSPYRRPQTPQAPFPYAVSELQFANPATPYLFHATLTAPKQAGRYPAVILVSGSGAQDRDENIFGHKPFAVIADQLSRHGIVVLRYDDRGWGSGDTNLYAGTTADYAADARSALRLLRSLPMVDTTRVGIIGHSEGGLIAEILAAEKGVDFAIFMAAPAVPGSEVLTGQSRYILEKQGASQTQIDQAMAAIAKMATDTSSINARWLQYFYHLDPKPLLRKIKKNGTPVLVLQGGSDSQVLPKDNLPVMTRLLGKKTAPVRCYPDHNHLFQSCHTGLPSEYADIEQTIDLQVLDDMQAFILSLGGTDKTNDNR